MDAHAQGNKLSGLISCTGFPALSLSFWWSRMRTSAFSSSEKMMLVLRRTSLLRSPSERARLVIDQARDVADSLLRKTLLDRAIGYLEELCPAPVEGADQVAAPAGDDSIPMTTRLWLDVALLSWKDEGKVVSTLEASFPYCVQHRFDPIRFKELCIDQVFGFHTLP